MENVKLLLNVNEIKNLGEVYQNKIHLVLQNKSDHLQ